MWKLEDDYELVATGARASKKPDDTEGTPRARGSAIRQTNPFQRGRVMDPRTALQLQRSVGNRATREAITVSRCGAGCHCESCADAVPVQRDNTAGSGAGPVQKAIDDTSVDQIDKLDHAQIQLASTDQMVALIKIILDKGGATHRLDLLWNGLKDSDVEANIGLWKTTWERYASVMGSHPRLKLFGLDVADTANAMLTESEAACNAYLDYYGLTPGKKDAGTGTQERSESLKAVQDKAVELMGAQTQIKNLRTTKIPTDRRKQFKGVPAFLPFDEDVAPTLASPEGIETWTKTSKAVKDLSGSIDDYLEAFPELYPLVMGGQSSKKDAYGDPSTSQLATEKPLDAIEKGLHETIKNIHESKGKTVEILARDRKLKPVEQQLISGARTPPGAAQRNWKTSPVFSAMAPTLTKEPGLITGETVLMFAFQIAIGVATGGIGNVVMGGVQLSMSGTEAGVIQKASDTSLGDKNAIVAKQEVAAANLAVALDAAFLLLDLVPAVKESIGVWGAARGKARLIEKAAEEVQKKALVYESKLMAKVPEAELRELQEAMQKEFEVASKDLDQVKSSAAKAQGAEKTLADGEVRKAAEALERAKTNLDATRALKSGEALVADIGGRRFSWVKGRGLVICSSPCMQARDYLANLGQLALDDANSASPLAGDMLRPRIASAGEHLAQVEQSLSAAHNVPGTDEFRRASAHADSILGEVLAQRDFAKLRFGAETAGQGMALATNDAWSKAVLANAEGRRRAIFSTVEQFYEALPNQQVAARDAALAEWEAKIAPNLAKIEDVGRKTGAGDANARITLMNELDKALTNYERELRGQRAIGLEGGTPSFFSDSASAAALGTTSKLDYVAELPGQRLLLGDSKGAGSVSDAVTQIEEAAASAWVNQRVAAGQTLECRVYLSHAEAARQGYSAIGHPPQLMFYLDGAEVRMTAKGVARDSGGKVVEANLPLYVIWN